MLFVGKNTDKGNTFCRVPTDNSIHLFFTMLKYNSKFHSQKLKKEVQTSRFQGIFTVYIVAFWLQKYDIFEKSKSYPLTYQA